MGGELDERSDRELDKPVSEFYFQGVNIYDFWVMHIGEVFFENIGQFLILMMILDAQCDCATELRLMCERVHDEHTCESVSTCAWEERVGPLLISIITTI